MRLLNRPPKTLEEKYFSEVRPLLFQNHGQHKQYGVRESRTLAEHLDSVCQFVLTVSKMADVPEMERGVILASAAVHDLNKLDKSGRKVKTLARDKAFLRSELKAASVAEFVPGDPELELARRLIERHSGHHVSDGSIFFPEDERIDRWASILRAADLFDLQVPDEVLMRKIRTELVYALNRPSNLYKVQIAEQRGYITSLLLTACEEILVECGLTPIAIFSSGELFEGERFPEKDIEEKIAERLQLKIDSVFLNNLEELIKAKPNGIRIASQAVQHDADEIVKVVIARLEGKKSRFKSKDVQAEVYKRLKGMNHEVLETAKRVGLTPVRNAEDFQIAEGLKAAFISYQKVKSSSPDMEKSWSSVFEHVGIPTDKQDALRGFEAQYARSLLAASSVTNGMAGIEAALIESLTLRKNSSESSNQCVSDEILTFVSHSVSLPKRSTAVDFCELDNYIQASARQRCSLGPSAKQSQDVSAMPIGVKVQVFSNRLLGGSTTEPRRQASSIALLAYQLMSVGSQLPKKSESPPYYLYFTMPEGTCPELLRIWRECLRNLAATNTEDGPVSVDTDKLYRDNLLEFKSEGVGFAFPKRSDFISSTVVIPITFGKLSSSMSLLKSVRLVMELSLSLEIGFPFVLSPSLQIETTDTVYGRIEGIPSTFSRLLESGQYNRQETVKIRDRLRWIGNIAQAISGRKHVEDCVYDLARSCSQPFSLYHIILRWILREQQNPNLGENWERINAPLNKLLESLMPEENKKLTIHLKNAAAIAASASLKGRSFNRTSITKPFTDFLKAIRSQKTYMDLDFLFASLSQDFFNHLDRIWNSHVGKTQKDQISEYYGVLRQLYEEVYDGRPEKLLKDRKQLEAAYLFFWQEAYQENKNSDIK